MLGVFIKARNMIADPSNWCQGFMSKRFPDGRVAYCARGAIKKQLSLGNEFPFCVELHKSLTPNDRARWAAHPIPDQIGTWNNTHTHQEVMDLFDHTIERLREQSVVNNAA